jgi:hypothetical protein
MGIRIDFYLNPNNSIIKILENDYQNFREWMINSYVIEPNPEKFFSIELINFLDKNNSWNNLIELDPKMIDEIAQNYFGDYLCGKFKHVGPSFYFWHYIDEAEIVKSICGEKVFQLWEFLYKGRSIIDKNNFFSPIKEFDYFKVGYWQKDELGYLLAQFNKYFYHQLKNYKTENKMIGITAITEILNEIDNLHNELIFVIC